MRFICDVMLGKLARYLRIFGLDAVYLTNYKELREKVDKDVNYLFITKRTKHTPDGSIVIKSDHVKEQLKEIFPIIKPFLKEELFFTRCLDCNELLKDVEKKDIEGLVPEYVFHNYPEFKRCPSCNKVFWAGSHIEHMERLIESFLMT